ncbi:MAG: Trk system potassium transporter TrkA, partial [Acidimicrobiia bacterium]|nr:Trk system potassium transporter TrkA [Acidimicrobiia bacterium]
WDERNILGCLLGRAFGAGTTVTRVNNHNLLPWLGEVGIDATVSSRLAAANAILRFVRRGLVHSVATFSDTDAEAIELEVASRSSVCGQYVVDLPLPDETVIGGILRNGDSFVPTGSSRVEAGDRLIIFALPSAIQTVETLFAE